VSDPKRHFRTGHDKFAAGAALGAEFCRLVLHAGTDDPFVGWVQPTVNGVKLVGYNGVIETWPSTNPTYPAASGGAVATQGVPPSPGLRPTSPRGGEVLAANDSRIRHLRHRPIAGTT
jgi:hypothetical protein